MTDRDRLIELIQKSNCVSVWDYHKDDFKTPDPISTLADHLLSNDVVVSPFKVGTKVYVITSATSDGKNLYIFEDIITAYQINMGYRVMCFDNHLGEPHWNWDKVFLTKEQAEEKLKELGK